MFNHSGVVERWHDGIVRAMSRHHVSSKCSICRPVKVKKMFGETIFDRAVFYLKG